MFLKRFYSVWAVSQGLTTLTIAYEILFLIIYGKILFLSKILPSSSLVYINHNNYGISYSQIGYLFKQIGFVISCHM